MWPGGGKSTSCSDLHRFFSLPFLPRRFLGDALQETPPQHDRLVVDKETRVVERVDSSLGG